MKSPDWDSVLAACSGDVRRLSYADRYTTIPVSFKENVAEHSYWVALYSLLIHRELGESEALTGPILSFALVHDMVECRSGDLVRTFKYLTQGLKNAVSEAEKLIETSFPPLLKNEFYAISSVQDQTDRAYAKAVVKTADFVSLHQYMIREVARGNSEIKPFFKRMQDDLIATGHELEKSPDPRISSQAHLFFLMAHTTIPGERTA
jgi:5'-deoxynucleotidase YfbR-like HD superfamily hydrolase